MEPMLTIKIKTAVVHPKENGSPPWMPGQTIRTTRKELAERNVPADAYDVIAPGSDAPAPGPGSEGNREGAKKNKK